MSIAMDISDLRREVAAQAEEINRLRHRSAKTVRYGTVEAVDLDRKRVRLLISDPDGGDKVLGPWRPWSEHAGAIKSWAPPSVGQQMILFSPNGDLSVGFHLPATFSEQNAAPSERPETYRVEIGGASIELSAREIVFSIDGTSLKLTADGLSAVADDYEFE